MRDDVRPQGEAKRGSAKKAALWSTRASNQWVALAMALPCVHSRTGHASLLAYGSSLIVPKSGKSGSFFKSSASIIMVQARRMLCCACLRLLCHQGHFRLFGAWQQGRVMHLQMRRKSQDKACRGGCPFRAPDGIMINLHQLMGREHQIISNLALCRCQLLSFASLLADDVRCCMCKSGIKQQRA